MDCAHLLKLIPEPQFLKLTQPMNLIHNNNNINSNYNNNFGLGFGASIFFIFIKKLELT